MRIVLIQCPRCNHSALWCNDSIIENAKEDDIIQANDFKVILSYNDQSFTQPRPGDAIRCHRCECSLVYEIRKVWKKIKNELKDKEWDT